MLLEVYWKALERKGDDIIQLIVGNEVKFCRNKKEFTGNIVSVNKKSEIVTVCYKNGRKATIDNIPFSDIGILSGK